MNVIPVIIYAAERFFSQHPIATQQECNVRFGSKADMCSALARVCFVPIADIRSPVCGLLMLA